MPVIEQKTTNKNKVDFDLNRLDKSKTTIFSKYPKFFGRYLRQHRLAILLLILSWGLLAASFALYGLPLAAVAYPALLSLLLCLAAAVWDYTRTLRRHRKL